MGLGSMGGLGGMGGTAGMMGGMGGGAGAYDTTGFGATGYGMGAMSGMMNPMGGMGMAGETHPAPYTAIPSHCAAIGHVQALPGPWWRSKEGRCS